MGYAITTCAVSGLPIQPGDPLRGVLFTQNPHEINTPTSYQKWFQRSWPLRGKFDFNSANLVFDDDNVRQTWRDGFSLDLVQQGYGDTIHNDLPIYRDMPWDDLIGALFHNFVRVSHDHNPFRVPLGIPTRKRVEKHLKDLPTFDGHQGVVVKSSRYTEVEVTVVGKPSTLLTRIEKTLSKKYAVLRTRSLKSFLGCEVLVVRPKANLIVGPKPYRFRPSQVMLGLIREDVWEGLCQVKNNPDLDAYRCVVDQAWSALAKGLTFEDFLNIPVKLSNKSILLGSLFDTPPLGETHSICPMWGLWRYYQLHLENPVPYEYLSQFLRDAAEFLYIDSILYKSYHAWGLPNQNGPAMVDWSIQQGILDVYRRVAGNTKP